MDLQQVYPSLLGPLVSTHVNRLRSVPQPITLPMCVQAAVLYLDHRGQAQSEPQLFTPEWEDENCSTQLMHRQIRNRLCSARIHFTDRSQSTGLPLNCLYSTRAVGTLAFVCCEEDWTPGTRWHRRYVDWDAWFDEPGVLALLAAHDKWQAVNRACAPARARGKHGLGHSRHERRSGATRSRHRGGTHQNGVNARCHPCRLIG